MSNVEGTEQNVTHASLDTVRPSKIDEVRDLVRSTPSVLPVGQRTKPPLSRVRDATLISFVDLSGIIEYEPSEFTFTAWAGTKVSEVAHTLAERNQYLPFDPILRTAGCTLGGTVASGGSGAGRARYGGLRDFLLGVQLVTGEGELIAVGGKVVKNAAGFDIPKLLVGSLGRYGVMTALTFKVFPKPITSRTYRIQCEDVAQATQRMASALTSRWEVDAAEYDSTVRDLYLRLAGPASAVDALGGELKAKWPGEVDQLEDTDAEALWSRFDALGDPPENATVVKVPSTLKAYRQLEAACRQYPEVGLRLSAAGAVAWLTDESGRRTNRLDEMLIDLGMTGLIFRGTTNRIWLGKRPQRQIDHAIKRALDPDHKFPPA